MIKYTSFKVWQKNVEREQHIGHIWVIDLYGETMSEMNQSMSRNG